MRLALLLVGIGVVEQRRAGAHLGDAVLHADGAQREAGVEVAVEADEADGAAVPGARRALVVLDELHRPRLRRARHGHRPGVGEEGVERVEAGQEPPFDVVDGVDQPRVHLDLAAADDPHAPGHADPRLVVAVDVGAHRQLGRVLGRVEQRQDLGGIPDGIPAARDGAGDGAGLHAVAVDAHVHLGRGADQVLGLAQVDEEAVGRRVPLAQPPEELRGRPRAPGVEGLARHDLEQVAALERLARDAHEGGVLPGLVIARAGRLGVADIRARGAVSRQAVGGAAVDLEVVAPALRDLAPMVDDDQLVRQVEDEVALIGRALELEPHRLELEGQVVAEGAVQAQVRLVLVEEQVDEGPQEGEHRGLAAALLLGEAPRGRPHLALDDVVPRVDRRHDVEPRERPAERGEQDPAARVQGLRPEVAPPRGEHDGRVDEAEVPARVAARILVARRQERAAALVEPFEDRLDGMADGDALDRAADGDAAARQVLLGARGRGHGPSPSTGRLGAEGRDNNAAPGPRERLRPSYVESVRARRRKPPLRGTATTTSRVRAIRSA